MTESPDTTATLGAVRASTAALVRGLHAERWTDADVQLPSLLPGWSRGHVLTHIARNADGITRTVAGALRGERLARYPDGTAGRNADIEAGAGRSSLELLADVTESSEKLDRVFSAVADADGWGLDADDRTTGDYLLARWREVEIHHVDLGGRYTPADWPSEFVAYLLPDLAGKLPQRTSTAVHVAVAPEGSVAPGLAGRSWSTPGADPVPVEGPDWAVLAWLLGRPHAAAGHLSASPELSSWG